MSCAYSLHAAPHTLPRARRSPHVECASCSGRDVFLDVDVTLEVTEAVENVVALLFYRLHGHGDLSCCDPPDDDPYTMPSDVSDVSGDEPLASAVAQVQQRLVQVCSSGEPCTASARRCACETPRAHDGCVQMLRV